MIYLASPYTTDNHHGALLSIAPSFPSGLGAIEPLPFFTPPDPCTPSDYRSHLKQNEKAIAFFLRMVDPSVDVTLIYSGAVGAFNPCSVLGELLKRRVPKSWGGVEIRNEAIAPKKTRKRRKIVPYVGVELELFDLEEYSQRFVGDIGADITSIDEGVKGKKQRRIEDPSWLGLEPQSGLYPPGSDYPVPASDDPGKGLTYHEWLKTL